MWEELPPPANLDPAGGGSPDRKKLARRQTWASTLRNRHQESRPRWRPPLQPPVSRRGPETSLLSSPTGSSSRQISCPRRHSASSPATGEPRSKARPRPRCSPCRRAPPTAGSRAPPSFPDTDLSNNSGLDDPPSATARTISTI
ncbi:hypothetical protein TIFTF001_011842 [Ficus carica]|uniref:Uncharacterized protein n=1 Tax=Ficus carica TaxID=3494 RepID=A0AA87ZSI0_FICCA|nr:hypothetical protein TIFTF001_011842 [Ficus carica]